MKNRYKLNTLKSTAIIFCPKLDGSGDEEVLIDKKCLKKLSKIEGTWSEMPNPRYPSEQFPTTFATIHKGQFIDMKRVILDIQTID